jgi:hypothetical protein
LLLGLARAATLRSKSRRIHGQTLVLETERERERERERAREKGEVVVVRDTTLVEGDGNITFCLKVPRQCPLVLLMGVRFYFKVIEDGGALELFCL